MGFLISSLLDIFGFGIGIPVGILVGFFLFVYSEPKDVQVPSPSSFVSWFHTFLRKFSALT